MIDRVLGAFEAWLADREPQPDTRQKVLDVVRTACTVKSDYIDPNPADWPPDVTAEVLGDILPRTIVAADDRYIRTLIPGMQTFVDFLVLTQRWKTHNDEHATREALLHLRGEIPERFTHPPGDSMGRRILQLAVDEGVDLDDSEQLGDFQDRYNAMPIEWRQRVIGGTTPHSDDPLDDDEFNGYEFNGYEFNGDENDDWSEEDRATLENATSFALQFADFRPGTPIRITVPPADDEWRALRETAFLGRILDMVAWVGPSRPVTSTGALSREDTREWAARLGLASAEKSRSMWDILPLSTPWRLAIDADLISITGKTAAPGPDAAVLERPGLERVAIARVLVRTLVEEALLPGTIADNFSLKIAAVLMSFLVSACSPGGQDVAGARSGGNRDVVPANPYEPLGRSMARFAIDQMNQLRDWGLLREIDGRVFVPPNLHAAMAEALNAPEAPFRFRLARGALPVAD
jgi:hypothetical protein